MLAAGGNGADTNPASQDEIAMCKSYTITIGKPVIAAGVRGDTEGAVVTPAGAAYLVRTETGELLTVPLTACQDVELPMVPLPVSTIAALLADGTYGRAIVVLGSGSIVTYKCCSVHKGGSVYGFDGVDWFAASAILFVRFTKKHENILQKYSN